MAAHPQLADDGEHRERRQHVFDGVAAQRAAEQPVDLQIEGLEHLGEAVPDGRPGQQPAMAVAPRRIGQQQQHDDDDGPGLVGARTG